MRWDKASLRSLSKAAYRTLLFDALDGAADAAAQKIRGRLDRLVEKERLDRKSADAAASRLEPVGSIGAFADCDTVIEAIIEDIDAKQTLFREIEGVVRSDSILASNTSSIPIASIASACKKRDRIAGLHFFNPVPLMKLVEVIRAIETSDQTVETLTALGERMTRTPGRGQG